MLTTAGAFDTIVLKEVGIFCNLMLFLSNLCSLLLADVQEETDESEATVEEVT